MIARINRIHSTQPTDPLANAATAYPLFYRTYSRIDLNKPAESRRETWEDTTTRALNGLVEMGGLTPEEIALIEKQYKTLKCLPSGRWLWVGGTDWVKKPENYPGAYNCCNLEVSSPEIFGLLMDLAMMGTGTGAVLEQHVVDKLPPIVNELELKIAGEIGQNPPESRKDETMCSLIKGLIKTTCYIEVGDSRKGWVDAYQKLIGLAMLDDPEIRHNKISVTIELSNVRPSGERLKGFGGVANPAKLEEMFVNVAKRLNAAVGRKLKPLEACMVIDEAASCIVAGSIRRSAGMRQFSAGDTEAATAKDNLWQQGEDGKWRIDPDRDALRMANHTRVFHEKPTLEECTEAVRKQYYSGEGAIQWACEAKRRAKGDNRYGLNPCFTGDTEVLTRTDGMHISRRIDTLVGETVEIFDGKNWVTCNNFRVTGENQYTISIGIELKYSEKPDIEGVVAAPDNEEAINVTPLHNFVLEDGSIVKAGNLKPNDRLKSVPRSLGYVGYEFAVVTFVRHRGYEQKVYCCTVETTHQFALGNGVMVGNCGEIIGHNFLCNLAEIHLNNIDPTDDKAQYDAFHTGGLTVAVLLNHQFQPDVLKKSREDDPIVGVSFTGLFDFFVKAFGVKWLQWWEAGRPKDWGKIEYRAGGQMSVPWDGYKRWSDYFTESEKQYLHKWRRISEAAVTEYCTRNGLKVPNRMTTVQPAGCLDKTALRVFDQGLLYADELVTPGSGETFGLNLSVRQDIHATTAIANEPLPLVRVTLSNGRLLRMTQNHRLSVTGQWVRADHLVKGMEIDHSIGEYTNTSEAQLACVNPSNYSRGENSRGVLSRSIRTPDAMNPDIGYFLGCLFGNGSISKDKYRVRIAFNGKDNNCGMVEKLQEIMEEHFGITGTIFVSDDDGKKTRGELCFASRQFYEWLQLNGLGKDVKSANLDRIPRLVRESSRETILSFFCGLIDTDGCVRSSGSLSIDSASEDFVRTLQQVGEAVGLSFSIFHNTEGQNLQGQKNMWGLCLSRMVSQPVSLEFLNVNSCKCSLRNIPKPKRTFSFHPYKVLEIEFESTPDYSYDFTVEGVDDDDSWYWQGGLKSHNSKSLLSGASPGWHPPKAQRFIRRITFGKNDPVALACIDYGYNVVPSQSDKDENGNLLDDPFDPRCTEWLVELPVEVCWANLPGADEISIEKFSALAQFDFYMQVQKYYTGHNSSSTIELRENEIEPLATAIYEAIRDDEGYISSALLARFDDLQTFPRLPFEPIDKNTYHKLSEQVLERRKGDDFHALLAKYEADETDQQGPAACDSDKCLMPESKPD